MRTLIALAAGTLLCANGCVAGGSRPESRSAVAGERTQTGKMLTPMAARGAIFQQLNPRHPIAPEIRAAQAAAIAVAPDGSLLAVSTSGYNDHFGIDGKVRSDVSTEYLFLFDIRKGEPRQLQSIPVRNTFQGMSWAPDSRSLYVSAGKDDAVLEFRNDDNSFVLARKIELGHEMGIGLSLGSGNPWSAVLPVAGDLAVSPNGIWLLVSNIQNDSVSLIDLRLGRVVEELDLRPGAWDPTFRGRSGGSYPRAVTWISSSRAYVASQRDRELISLLVEGKELRIQARISVPGQPVDLISHRAGSRLYAALDNSDRLVVLDTQANRLIEELNVAAPKSVFANPGDLGGANSNGLALTPDEKSILVTNGGQNSVAVVRLGAAARAPEGSSEGPQRSAVVGLVPTGMYPTGVATSRCGDWWYIINAKSTAGPNVDWCRRVDLARNLCIGEQPPGERRAENGHYMLRVHDQIAMQLQRAGLLAMPAPSAHELTRLTRQVASNNGLNRRVMTPADMKLFSFLRERIKHIIYVVKQNRTYDQLFGDLGIGNADPRLAVFPEHITPNHHRIARQFVTLDNFLLSGEGHTGLDWTTAAMTTDYRERQAPLFFFQGGMTLDIYGSNRNINMGYATSAERNAVFPVSPTDPDILPGARDVSAPDGPGGEEGRGYIWDAALRRGLSVRNYGLFGDFVAEPGLASVIEMKNAFEAKRRVSLPTKPSLIPLSDPYYPPSYQPVPDYWRFQEWKREFDEFSRKGVAPNLMLVALPNDHTGGFDSALDGVDTPESQVADNDYALGLMVEAVAQSPFSDNTLIVSIEDDPWDGPDHVDAFRSIVLFAGPYVRRNALISTRFTTVNVLRTIEEILGIGPMNLNDAFAAPMSEVFDDTSSAWSYEAVVPDVLRSTRLPLPDAVSSE